MASQRFPITPPTMILANLTIALRGFMERMRGRFCGEPRRLSMYCECMSPTWSKSGDTSTAYSTDTIDIITTYVAGNPVAIEDITIVATPAGAATRIV